MIPSFSFLFTCMIYFNLSVFLLALTISSVARFVGFCLPLFCNLTSNFLIAMLKCLLGIWALVIIVDLQSSLLQMDAQIWLKTCIYILHSRMGATTNYLPVTSYNYANAEIVISKYVCFIWCMILCENKRVWLRKSILCELLLQCFSVTDYQ